MDRKKDRKVDTYIHRQIERLNVKTEVLFSPKLGKASKFSRISLLFALNAI